MLQAEEGPSLQGGSSNHLPTFCQHHIMCGAQGLVRDFTLVEDTRPACRQSRRCLPCRASGSTTYRREKGNCKMPNQWYGCCIHHVLSLGVEFNCFPYRFK